MQPPKNLIDSNGRVTLGMFDGPVAQINHSDYQLQTPMGKRVGSLRRHLAYNQFQFFGVVSDSLLMGCAIIDIKYISSAFIYFFHPPTGTLIERSFKLPLGFGLTQVQSPIEGTARFQMGRNLFEMTSNANERTRTLTASLATGESVNVTLDEASPEFSPMCICTRAGLRGWVYAQKTAGVTARGSVEFGEMKFDLEEIDATGHHDWSAGYMRRETWWNWACLSGRLPDGRLVGMNVSCGVNESSFTESCFWIDGRLFKVDTVAFQYDPDNMKGPWHIRSVDGQVNLSFTPQGSHGEHIDAVVVASNFEQMFGRFEGTLGLGDQSVEINGQWGYTEEHFAKW